MDTGAFERFFGDLEDHRQSAKVAHLFSDILFLLVCASIAGAKGCLISIDAMGCQTANAEHIVDSGANPSRLCQCRT